MPKFNKAKLIKAMSWQYQYANPDPDVLMARRALVQPTAMNKTRAKHILWDSDTNSYKQYKVARKRGYRKAHQLLNYLMTHKRIAPDVSLYLYTGIVTFKNLSVSKDKNGKPVILTPDGHNAYKMLKAVELKLKDWFKGDYSGRSKGQQRFNHNALMLVNAIETAIFKGIKDGRKDIFNIHEHIIFALMNEILPIQAYTYQNGKRKPKYTVWQEVTNYLNRYFKGITVSIRPLVNMKTKTTVVIDSTTTSTDLGAIFATTTYALKSGKLPQPKKWDDYYSFSKYPHQTLAVSAILNTIPKGMRLSSVLSFKPKERKQNAILMAIINATLKLFKSFSLRGDSRNSGRIMSSSVVLPFRFDNDKSPPLWKSSWILHGKDDRLNIRKLFYSTK